MQIGVLGTGMVGVAIANKLIQLGHDVTMGAREASNEKAAAWKAKAGARARTGTFRDAASVGSVVFNCTRGESSVALLGALKDVLKGKVVVDVANPLDFSKGMPPTLTVSNTDSLGEQVQRALPDTKVVKALNTLTAALMVDPRALPEETAVFVCGNDAGAKATVSALLQSFGWKEREIVDLGGIAASRGTEAWLLLWVQLMGALKTPMFNLRLPKATA
mgnify:CR=1 FL=1